MKGMMTVRTRLPSRPAAIPPAERSARIKPELPRIRVLPGLLFTAVLTAGLGLASVMPGIEQGVLLSAGMVAGADLSPTQTASVPETSVPSSLPVESMPTEAAEDASLPSESSVESVSEEVSSEPEPEESSTEEISQPEPQPEPEIPEENKAALVHKTYTAAPSDIYLPLEAGFIKNCTTHTSDEILAQAETPPYFTIDEGDEPQVLIMHTHTTECYLPFTGDYYDTTLPTRTTDNSQNMAAVGEVIAQQLEEAGIGVIHDVTQHDYPAYNGSYDRSAVTVQNYLDQYPSIKVVLDIHRDAIISGDTVTAPVATCDGETAAQVMIISGCDSGNMNYPNYMQNLSFGAALQVQMEKDHPGFTRPLLFDYRKYNQHLTNGSILIEVGSHGNTLEQALRAGEWIGDSLGILLNSLRS